MNIALSDDDQRRLIPLLESAIAEVDASAQPDATIIPDDPFSLMASYDWAHALLFKLRVATATEPSDPHVTARVKCRICNYVCQTIAPEGTDMHNLECARCHHMTMEPES